MYVSTIHLLLLKQKYEISPLRFTSVEMTYMEKTSISCKTLIVNNLQKQKIRKQNVSRHSNLQSDVPNTSSRAKSI